MPSSPYLVSQVITATMLFLQFMLYSSSFVGTLKNEIPEAALELCQLKIKQLSPDILKFRTKHKDNQDNPFTLNCFWFPAAFYLYFMQASVDWVLIIFGTQVIKIKRPVRLVFPDYLSVSFDYELTKNLKLVKLVQKTISFSRRHSVLSLRIMAVYYHNIN